MPGIDGVETLAGDELDATKVILLTAGVEPAEVLRAVRRGARGVVFKQAATAHLINGIRKVVGGKLLIADDIVDDLAQALRQARVLHEKPYGLTSRELEIVRAIAAGDSNREIAARFEISLQTVKHHLTSIFDKTGTSTRLELALFAIRNRLDAAL
jgi:DNA-binding NarL/FixJ family response regulator